MTTVPSIPLKADKPIIAIRAVNIIDLVPEKDQDGNVVMKEQVSRHRFEFKREGSDVWEDVEIVEERSYV